MPGKPIFGTVLVKRKANESPPDWELRLRPICQKIRVVEKLLGGAHAMVTGNPSVAVRIYNTDDAGQMEAIDDDNADGIDGLRNFRDSYEHSIVFFVLPSGQQQRDQLGRRDSFVNTAQKSLLWRDKVADENENGKKRRTTRTAIVSDLSQVIQTIDSLVQSLTPEKREKRRKYFTQIAKKNILPGPGTEPTQEAIANHVTKSFNTWAERFEMPDGDANVALSMLGSLSNVATANARTLDDIPIRNDSKELISCFFGANKNAADDSPIEEDKIEAHSNDDDQFYDNIDDSELMECPNPSTVNNTIQPRGCLTPFPTQDLQATRNRPMVQNNQSVSGNIDFTPMVPSRPPSIQQPGYNATSSIFPDESFPRQSHFPQPRSTGECHGISYSYQNQMHGTSTSAVGGISQQHLSLPPGSQGDNYQSFQQASGSVKGFQDTNHGYGEYTQSARYNTQQFM